MGSARAWSFDVELIVRGSVIWRCAGPAVCPKQEKGEGSIMQPARYKTAAQKSHDASRARCERVHTQVGAWRTWLVQIPKNHSTRL